MHKDDLPIIWLTNSKRGHRDLQSAEEDGWLAMGGMPDAVIPIAQPMPPTTNRAQGERLIST
jgi:hypothetical protein